MLFTVLYLTVCYATVDLPSVLGLGGINYKQEFGQDLFPNGIYMGQTVTSEGHGNKIPHGQGTFLFNDGTIAYSGSWWKGFMHGQGTRFMENGQYNYTGNFHYNAMNGEGQMFFANGSHFSGHFRNNRLHGPGNMTYSNGDYRIGTIQDDVWEGSVKYFDHMIDHFWLEEWFNGTYKPSLQLYKMVQKNSSDVDPEVICRVHAIDGATPILSRNGFPINNLEPHADGEFITINFKLDLNLEMVTEFTCSLLDNPSAEKNLTVHNPFSLEAIEQCGIQANYPEIYKGRLHKRNLRSLFATKVVDGSMAYRGQIPWQAAVSSTIPGFTEEKGPICGGVIISAQYILTGAHCLKHANGTFPVESLKVKVGMTTWPDSLNGQYFRVRKFYVHANFSDEIEKTYMILNDIAVLVLERSIHFNKYVSPICLPTSKTLRGIKNLDPLTVSGFGATFEQQNIAKGWFPSPFLQIATVFLHSIDVCIPPIHEKAIKFKGHLCAGGQKTQGTSLYSDSCSGDSGGPLTFQDKTSGKFILIGLVSWGSRYCGQKPGSVYVNVAHYLDWIQKVQLDSIVDEYQSSGRLPYEKVDRAMFQTIFDHLVTSRNDIL